MTIRHNRVVPVVVASAFLVGACNAVSPDGPSGGEGAATGSSSTAGAGGASSAGGGGAPSWEELSWASLEAAGDPAGDCTAEDATCSADILQLSLARLDPELHVLLELATPLPTDGSLEVLLIPVDPAVEGRSARWQSGRWWFWRTTCASARHSGCHWYDAPEPEGFQAEWVEPSTLWLRFDAASVGLDGLDALMSGVGVAPFAVSATAEFTDRYPDELWITDQDIKGLETVPLVVPR